MRAIKLDNGGHCICPLAICDRRSYGDIGLGPAQALNDGLVALRRYLPR
jgi:hypothetical protein